MIACFITAAWLSCANVVAPGAGVSWFHSPAVSRSFIERIRAQSVPVGLLDPIKAALVMTAAIANLAPAALATGDQSAGAERDPKPMIIDAIAFAGAGITFFGGWAAFQAGRRSVRSERKQAANRFAADHRIEPRGPRIGAVEPEPQRDAHMRGD
ncbi:MAG TPA: hypothetical protein VMU87_01320 [Stellaceae bacterium]|nr:hypothetical protein [Stellaceae bacterium]